MPFIKTHLALIFALLIIVTGTVYRINIARSLTPSGDLNTHLRAVTDLLYGKNPYTWTVESYKNLENDPGNKGYAYFPAIMYTNSVLYLFYLYAKHTLALDLPLPFLLQIPGIIASIFIGIFFIKYFYNKGPASNLAMIFCAAFWFFSPYILSRHSDIGYDAIAVALLIWALYYLEKNDVASGLLYSLAVLVKTFPIILIFIFLFKARNKLKFIATGLIILFVASAPFLKSIDNFSAYIQGALLVHSERFVQGRPYLYYISYFYHVELFRIIPFKVYSVLSLAAGWVVSLLVLLWQKIKDKYVLATIPFLFFYLFTPVLNRTYLMWGVPVFLVGLYSLYGKKYRWLFYAHSIAYWGFSYWYLVQWRDGFHIWHPI